MPNYTPVDTSWVINIPIVNDRVAGVPGTGDKRTAANIDPMYERLGDRLAYLNRINQKQYVNSQSGSPLSQYGDYSGITSGWDPVNSDYGQDLYEPNSFIDIPGRVAGDQILVSAVVTMSASGATSNERFLMAIDDVTGTPSSHRIPGTIAGGPGYSHNYWVDSSGGMFQFALSAVWTVVNPGTTRVAFGMNAAAGVSAYFYVWEITVKASLFAKL